MPRIFRAAYALLAAGALLLAASHDLAAQTRRALLIGINRYDLIGPREPPGSVGPSGRELIDSTHALDGAVNDAESMRDLLRDRFMFDSAHIVLLEDTAATRDHIISAIERLAAEAQPGDIVVFYYAGHGSQRVNSGSTPTGLDQTIVPVDANLGVFDIRNKELARLFYPLVQKGVILTLIFDSCHSGAIVRDIGARYRERWAARDPRDAADSATPPAPEDHGALVLSAAQDYQTAGEVTDNGDSLAHGVFTAALLSVLRSSAPDEPAARIFQRVRALMQATGRPQEPVLAGRQREHMSLLGGAAGATSGVTTVAVLRPDGPRQLDLQGGLAIGLRVGTELVPLGRRQGAAAVRLRVTAVQGLSRSTAEVVEGSPSAIHFVPPDLFQIDRWAPGPTAGLRVWMPEADLDRAMLSQVSAVRAQLQAATRIRWIDDPTPIPSDGTPLAVLQRRGGGWVLEIAGQLVARLPEPLTARGIQSALQRTEGDVRLFALLPPSPELRTRLELGRGTHNDLVQVVTDRGAADYLLVGRLREGQAEYAWVRPNASTEGANSSTLPTRSDWATATPGGAPSAISGAATGLVDEALRLATVRSWLTMEGPPQNGAFPYHLALRDPGTGALRTDGPLYDGSCYGLVLRADSAQLGRTIERRFVYVFAIDSKGKGVLLFPTSNVFNKVPYEENASGQSLREIRLGADSVFCISGPSFGMDTYVLLTSDEALPTDALEWEGAQREGTREAGDSPLASLLFRNTTSTRGPDPRPVPVGWSIERLPILSAPKPENRGH